MAVSKLLLRCPYCDWPFEVKPPDSLHSAYSFEKPLRGSFYGEVILIELDSNFWYFIVFS